MASSELAAARTILANLPAAEVLGIVDQLDLSARPGQSSIAIVALKSLKQRRKVGAFLDTAPPPAVFGLLEAITQGPLHHLVEVLGEASDDPTEEQLAQAVDHCAEEMEPRLVAAVLAYGVLEDFVAAPHCAALLAQHPEWGLAELFSNEG